jgi:putative ABC transport system ATP-binding protein
MRSLYVEPERAVESIAWPALELRDVFRIFRSGPVETVALRGLDLRVDAGQFVAVLGPSGCGKSTLLHLAAGMDRASAGEVRVAGRSLGVLREEELAALRAREIAVVLQSGNLWSALSALENVALCVRLAGRDGRGRTRGEALEALERFGLRDRAGHRPHALSGGEQQRVAIAAAAARRPALVLADEPTGELDAANEAVVLDALRRLRDDDGVTLLAVTHSEHVAAAAHRVVEMRDGTVVRS